MTPMIDLPLLSGPVIRREFTSQIKELRKHLRGSGIRSDNKAKLVWNRIERSLIVHYGILYWMRGFRCSADMVLNGWLAQNRAEPANGRIAEVVNLYGSRVVFALCGLADAWAGAINGPGGALRYLAMIEKAELRTRMRAAQEQLAYKKPRQRIRRPKDETLRLIAGAETNLLESSVPKHELNKRISAELGLSTEYIEKLRRTPRKRWRIDPT